jgi:hypothetical protein
VRVVWWYSVVCAHLVTWDPSSLSVSAQPSPLSTHSYPNPEAH